jgi:hypothetical protein
MNYFAGIVCILINVEAMQHIISCDVASQIVNTKYQGYDDRLLQVLTER